MTKGQVSSVTCDAPSVNCNLLEPRDTDCECLLEQPRGFEARTANKKKPRKPRRGGMGRPLKARMAEAREISASIVPIELAPVTLNEAIRSLGGNNDPRRIVNHLRHRASNYEELISRYSRDMIKRRTLAEIGERHPSLRTECERQADELLVAN